MSRRFQTLPMPTVEDQPTCDLCGEEFDDSTWEYERIYDMDLFHNVPMALETSSLRRNDE